MCTKLVHCKKEKHNVYIGRPSPWGNPWSHRESSFEIYKTNTVEEAIQNFEDWLNGTRFNNILQNKRKYILENVHTLKGKTLGCWCPVNKCHGNILIKLANEIDDCE